MPLFLNNGDMIMKKTFKRLIVLFFVIVLNINAYAVIAGHDASAFITKAEFDAFVENFNKEMDDYEYNITSKIDGSIANYILGLGRDIVEANMIINNAQKSQVYRFTIWKDPGCTTTGRHITASGTISSQVNMNQMMEGFSLSVTSNTSSTTNNKCRYFQNDFMGYKCYKGITYPYINTTWTISGVLVTTTTGTGTIIIGTSVSNCRFSRTAPNTNVSTTTQQQYWSSSFTDSSWGTKYGYLTHNQSWKKAAADENETYYLSSSPLGTSEVGFVREEYKGTDSGLVRNSTSYSLNTSASSNIQVNKGQSTLQWIETMPNWIVATENIAWTSLYNYMSVAQGYPVKLYEGLAYFEATATGTATIKLGVTGGSTDITYADLAISSNKFDNAYISSGSSTDKMTTISPAYTSDKSTPQELKNVTMARVKCGDEINIQMEVKKGKIYYIKLTPRTSYNSTAAPAAGKYAYVNKNLPVITIEVNNESKKD